MATKAHPSQKPTIVYGNMKNVDQNAFNSRGPKWAMPTDQNRPNAKKLSMHSL